MTTSKHNLRSTIFSLTFTAAAIAMLGCGVDSGSTPSEPAVCDTDSCDLDNNNAWSCVCDLNQDGTFCDPFHAAPGGGSEADWCGTACIAIGTHGSFACANNCDEADGFSGVGNYDSDANKVACS